MVDIIYGRSLVSFKNPVLCIRMTTVIFLNIVHWLTFLYYRFLGCAQLEAVSYARHFRMHLLFQIQFSTSKIIQI